MRKIYSLFVFALVMLSMQVSAVTRTVHVFDSRISLEGVTDLRLSCRYTDLTGPDIEVSLQNVSFLCYDAVLDLPSEVTALSEATVAWTDSKSVKHSAELKDNIDITWGGLLRLQRDIYTSADEMVVTNPTHTLKLRLRSKEDGWNGNTLRITNKASLNATDYAYSITMPSGTEQTVTVPLYAPTEEDNVVFCWGLPNAKHDFDIVLKNNYELYAMDAMDDIYLEMEHKLLNVTEPFPEVSLSLDPSEEFMTIKANWESFTDYVWLYLNDVYYAEYNGVDSALIQAKETGTYKVTLGFLNITKDFKYNFAVENKATLNLTDLDLHVLVHYDSGFDVEGMVIKGDDGGQVNLVPDPALGDHWYKAFYPAAGLPDMTWYITNAKGNITNSVWAKLSGGTKYFELSGYDYSLPAPQFQLKTCSRDAQAHDYRILSVDAPKTKGMLNVSWTSKDIAPRYYWEVYDKDDNRLSNGYENEPHVRKMFTISGKDYRIEIHPVDKNTYLLGLGYVYNGIELEDYEFGCKLADVDGVVVSSDKLTYTFNWEFNGPDTPVEVLTLVQNEYYDIIDTILMPLDQKTITYTVPRGMEGDIYFRGMEYDGEGYANALWFRGPYTIPEQPMNELTINALITPDNGHDFNGNVYAWVWSGSDPSTGKCVQLTAYSAQGKDWYRATVGGLTSSKANLILMDGPVSDYTDIYTSVFYTASLDEIQDQEIYVTLAGNWDITGRAISYVDKNAKTHDYRISDFKCEVSVDGRTRHYTWTCANDVWLSATYNDVSLHYASGDGEYTMVIERFGDYNFSISSEMDYDSYGFEQDYGSILPAGNIETTIRVYIPAETKLDPSKSLQLAVEEYDQPLSLVNLVREGTSNWYSAKVATVTEPMFDFRVIYDREGTDERYSYYETGIMNDVCYEWTPYPGTEPMYMEKLSYCQGIDYALPKVTVSSADLAVIFKMENTSEMLYNAYLYNAVGQEVAYASAMGSDFTFSIMSPKPGTYTYVLKPLMHFTGIELTGKVTTKFADKLYFVQITNDGNGDVNYNSDPLRIKLAEGAVLTLNASPYYGYVFDQWSDGNKENPRVLTIKNSDINLTAQFRKTSVHHLTVTAAEGGSVNALSTDYEEGECINLYAVADTYYYFKQWSDGNTDNPREFIMPNSDVNLTAQFGAYDMYSLTVVAIGEGTTDITTGKYPAGTKVKITATPKAGNAFLNWSSKSAVGTDNYEEKIIEIELTSDLVLAAIFADTNEDNRVTFRAKVADDQDEWGSVKAAISAEVGGEKYTIPVENKTVLPKIEDGIKVKVSATPAAGYKFLNWNEDSDLNEAERTLTVKKNTTITAYFKKNAEGVENVDADVDVNKRIENGMLIITRDGKDYTITGQRL